MKATLSLLPIAFGVAQAYIQGFDISHYQGTIDFAGAYSDGARFVIIKATEGTDYLDPGFSDHYDGATKAGLIRGGYHFARPDVSGGAAQAKYFFDNGGGWTADGITLPGMVDLEAGPDSKCYGLSTSSMVSWIQDFSDQYHSSSGRYPLIYANRDWWTTCTGDSSAFSSTSPLVLASWNDSPGTIPGGSSPIKYD